MCTSEFCYEAVRLGSPGRRMFSQYGRYPFRNWNQVLPSVLPLWRLHFHRWNVTALYMVRNELTIQLFSSSVLLTPRNIWYCGSTCAHNFHFTVDNPTSDFNSGRSSLFVIPRYSHFRTSFFWPLNWLLARCHIPHAQPSEHFPA
jgi:hypothetical protein